MKKNEKIEQEIEKTLDLLDNNEPLPPNPYFYTRVQQRINEKSKKEFSFIGILKPALFTSLIALNLITAIWYTSSDSITINSENELKLADILKSDFNLDDDQTENLLFE